MYLYKGVVITDIYSYILTMSYNYVIITSMIEGQGHSGNVLKSRILLSKVTSDSINIIVS